MKKLFKNSLLLLALLSVLFTSCRKDYPEPPIDILPVGDVITIDSLLKITPGTTFRDDCSLYGIVTMDEQSGNLYKAAFIQDRRTGAAVELYMDATSGLHVGDSIRVYLKDVTFDLYNGLPQLSGFSADGHIIILDNERPIQPTLTTIGEIVEGGDKYLGRLVRLENVMFAGKNTFADPTGYGERTLLDPMDLQHSAIVRTSNYANFAKDSLPQGTGNLVVIASLYKTNSRETWQFLIRSAKELEFEGYSPGSGLPYFQEFSSDFGTYTTYSVAGDQEWEIDYSTAKMTGHVGNDNYVNEDWLISAPVAITGVEHAKACVNYAAMYQNSNTEDVTLQVSKNYVAGTDPLTADWIQMPVTYPNTSGWSEFKTVEASLDEFIGQSITVAVKFTSSATQSRTIEIKYIAIMEGEASNNGGGGGGGELQSMPYTQSFTSDFGTYMAYDVVGPQSWEIAYSTAKMSGYESGNYVNEDWLISSPVSVTGVQNAKASVTYVAQYQNSDAYDVTMQVSTDYVFGEDPTTANWTQLSVTYPNTGGWQDFQTVETSLNNFIGQDITVAIKFTSTERQSRTFEVQTITVQEGEANGVNPTPPGPGGEVQSLPYAQAFESDFGTYLTKDVLGAQSWEIKYSSATMTGYVNPSYYANEDWLISSPVDLSGVNSAKMTVEYIGRYFTNINNDVTVWASTNYSWDDAPSAATWTQVPASWREASNWNDFLTAEIALVNVAGQPLVGQTITFAVKYVSTNDKAGTMEIKSITIEEGGDIPTPPTPGPGGEVQNMPYDQSFASDFGTYTTYDVLGPQSWEIAYNTAKMTGYSGGSHANEDWLLSSPVAITGVDHAKVSVTYSAQYQNADPNDVTLLVSTDYEFGSDPVTAAWTQTTATYPNTSSFNDFKTVETSLDNYLGQNVTVAIRYTSTDSQSRTIEIQNITVQEGEAGGVEPTPPTPGPGGGSGTYDDPYNVASGISNQGQSGVWVQGYIVGCVKSGTDHNTVTSNADIDWSAPFGRATNVLIADDASCNEISQCLIVKLPVSTPLRVQVNLVDHPENLGKLLTVKGTLGNGFGKPGVTDCPGAQGDFVLEGGDNPTPPPTPPTGIFSETFANGQGQFVIKDVNLPSALTFVWAHNSTYSCMKASAFKNQAYEAESWLVSPAIDLTGVSTASLSFEQAVNYASPQGALSVMISTDYAGEVSQCTWAELRLNQWPSGSDWTFITSTTDLTSYAGQTVTIAFKYTSTTSASCTWEVRNIVVE